MKKTAILILLAAAMASCNDAANNDAANAPKADSTPVAAAPPAAPPMDSAAAAKAWMDYMTPGDMQKMLATSVGKWGVEVTYWMDEKAPPQTSTGSSENKMILGGRYLQTTQTGTMMGMPYEGLGMLAYDNAKKVFVNTWQDNMGTGIMYMEGTYDTATKVMNMTGTCQDPVKGKSTFRQTYKIVDDKHHEMAMYSTPEGGKETKWMEMKLTKK